MSKLAAQIIKGRVEDFHVKLVGKNFEEDVCERTFDTPYNYQPFTIAAIKGLLELMVKETVSYVSAPYLAKDRNISVTESKIDHYDKFNDLIVLKVKTDKEEKTIGGTVFNDGMGRILFIDDFYLDVIPNGVFLYLRTMIDLVLSEE